MKHILIKYVTYLSTVIQIETPSTNKINWEVQCLSYAQNFNVNPIRRVLEWKEILKHAQK